MGYKWVTVKGSSGEKSFKVEIGSEKFYVSDGSDSLGTARSMDDALSLIKSTYRGKVYGIDVGDEHSSSCFPASTLIATPKGPISIARLAAGDCVWSLGAEPRLQRAFVTRFVEHDIARLWEIEVATRDKPIQTTAAHSFLTQRGWVRCDKLRALDRLVEFTGDLPCEMSITSVSPTDRFEPVYNLHTTGAHSFIADGVVVHNFTWARAARTLMHRLLVDPLLLSTLEQLEGRGTARALS